MSRQKNTRLYWKDALRQVQHNLNDEAAAARQHQWTSAFHQAQADLKDPSAIVWLPDEIIEVIRNHPVQEAPPPHIHRQRLSALIVALVLLVPAAISYLLAYRRMSALR